MIRVREFVLVFLTAVFVIFAFQNFDTVEVAFLAWQFSVPLALIALVPLLTGLVVGTGATAIRLRRRRSEAEPEALQEEDPSAGLIAEGDSRTENEAIS